ncbi:MAG: T9SS type A sorting domain-containing protein [Bacteroidia bacterium]
MKSISFSILIFLIGTINSHAQTETLVLVKDVFDNDVSHAYPNGITSFGSKILFMGDDGIHGREPWVSDGTEAGTFMLKDILEGEYSSVASSDETDDYQNNYFTPINGKMIFRANDGVHGSEPWITDGTPEGTMLLKDVLPGDDGCYPTRRSLYNGKIYFRASYGQGNAFEMWVTDGTTEGTQRFHGVAPSGFGYSAIHSDGKLYFNADSAGIGQELWVTDGTVSGTMMVKDAYPGVYSHEPSYIISLGDKLIYSGDSAGYSEQPWVSDGTEEGTYLIKQINSSNYQFSRNYFAFDGRAYFCATQDATTGRELWVTDGTEAGTNLLKEIGEGNAEGNPGDFIEFNERLWFIADGEEDHNLWTCDGTTEGTYIFHEDANGPMLVHNNMLYFISNGNVMITDGTVAGTYEVANPPGDASPAVVSMVANDNNVFVVARFLNSVGYELYTIEDILVINKLKQDSFTLYPNPASDYIQLKEIEPIGKDQNVMVSDITGRIIYSDLIHAGQTSAAINISAFEGGTYIISIGNSRSKFIKN